MYGCLINRARSVCARKSEGRLFSHLQATHCPSFFLQRTMQVLWFNFQFWGSKVTLRALSLLLLFSPLFHLKGINQKKKYRWVVEQDFHWNKSFPSCHKPLFQGEAQCEAIDMKMIFYSHANDTHYHNKILHLPLF